MASYCAYESFEPEDPIEGRNPKAKQFPNKEDKREENRTQENWVGSTAGRKIGGKKIIYLGRQSSCQRSLNFPLPHFSRLLLVSDCF
jgi:hypothetical protein